MPNAGCANPADAPGTCIPTGLISQQSLALLQLYSLAEYYLSAGASELPELSLADQSPWLEQPAERERHASDFLETQPRR